MSMIDGKLAEIGVCVCSYGTDNKVTGATATRKEDRDCSGCRKQHCPQSGPNSWMNAACQGK